MNLLPTGTIIANNLSKRYRLGVRGTLFDILSPTARKKRAEDPSQTLWALKDISFRVEPGESLGLIGPNGAGKTTVLKLLSNITSPTEGDIAVSGRISSLIELGAGFHPELTGRENVFLNGSILGLSRKEIQEKLDDIVAFAELERFIDTPLKRYSSGMYVRLGFAVAAHVQPDVLLVDEVLTVGDASFRQKCQERMETLRRDGTSILFVSHNSYQVRRICSRAMLLVHGKALFLGETSEAISRYEDYILSSEPEKAAREGKVANKATAAVLITDVSYVDQNNQPIRKIAYDSPGILRIRYHTAMKIVDPIIKVRILRSDGTVCGIIVSRYEPGLSWTLMDDGEISLEIEMMRLISGSYSFDVRILESNDSTVYANGQSAQFSVRSPGMPHETDRGVFLPVAKWHQSESQNSEQ